ncbi:meiotic recombination protein REC114 isoform X3 [Onychostoma macrolepis]|uniref:meiotic recombination protein REC114 isoform X3 n=1 Tax=Onychostoma macrolepis TaxID=369639 RepID=UPI00272D6E04|nr:meiotic recombination protein REC114 isoform X3 [Onychostoma macrolepis]
MESDSSHREHSTISDCVWKLRRYGQFLPEGSNVCAWKIFESSESTGKLELNILGSGHLLVSQGQELMGESRLIRLQFDGSNRAEAAEACRKAVERLQDYVPVQEHLTTPASAAPSDPAEPGPSTQQQQAPEDAPQAAPAVAMGPLSIKHLSQYFLGERELSLPMAYHQCTLPSGDLEALLRVCLLDSGFPAFVEEVEKKMKELLQE